MSIMTEQQYRARVRYVIGPDGSPLTVADLPPKDTKRWVIRRKAEVVAAVRGGLLSLEEACERNAHPGLPRLTHSLPRRLTRPAPLSAGCCANLWPGRIFVREPQIAAEPGS